MTDKNQNFEDERFENSRNVISNELANLRDSGLSDEEIYRFAKSVINHYHPNEIKRIKQLSEKQDALWREANDY